MKRYTYSNQSIPREGLISILYSNGCQIENTEVHLSDKMRLEIVFWEHKLKAGFIIGTLLSPSSMLVIDWIF